MRSDDPDIIKTLRKEERLGRLHSRDSGGQKIPVKEERENNHLESMFTLLKHHIEDMPTIDLGDPIEKYRIIFDNSAVAIMLTDENERIVHWNSYTEKLLGMGRDELVMKPVKNLYPQDEWKKIRSENIRQKGIKYHMQTKMIRKDNQLVDVDISLSVLKDHIGNVIGSIGIIKDTSQYKQMERALQTSEETAKQLYEKAPVPYETISPNGTITNVNEKWCQLLGYTKTEVIGTSLFDYIHCEEQDTVKSFFYNKITNEKPCMGSHEWTYITKNGEPRVFINNDFLNVDVEGAALSVCFMMDDVTEQKKIEEELRKAHYWLERKVQERTVELSKLTTSLKKKNNEYKRTVGELHIELEKLQKSQRKIEQNYTKLRKLDRVKSNFLTITGHELRTSLSTIKGYAEVLLMKSLGPLNEEQKKGLGVMLLNTNRLTQLIQDVLDITHLESGMMKFNLGKTNLKKLVDDAIKTSQPAADTKQITIRKDIAPGFLELTIDKDRVKQVFITLLHNAIESSPDHSTITVRVNKESDDVLCEIHDAGHRIPLNKQKKIFDIIYQTDSGGNRTFGESGLGLTISRGIILSHGGRIWIENENIKGNILRFTLPVKSFQQRGGKLKDVDLFRL